MRILIYSQDLEELLVITDYLYSNGYDVICCDNEEFVSDFLRLNETDIISINIVDGDDEILIIKELKLSADTCSIKLIVIGNEFEKLYLKIGDLADEIMCKPIDMAKLNHRIVGLVYE